MRTEMKNKKERKEHKEKKSGENIGKKKTEKAESHRLRVFTEKAGGRRRRICRQTNREIKKKKMEKMEKDWSGKAGSLREVLCSAIPETSRR